MGIALESGLDNPPGAEVHEVHGGSKKCSQLDCQ